MEQFVIQQIRAIGRDPAVLTGTLGRLKERAAGELSELQARKRGMERELGRHHVALAQAPHDEGVAEQLHKAEEKLASLVQRIDRLRNETVDPAEVASALPLFGPMWERVGPRERGWSGC